MQPKMTVPIAAMMENMPEIEMDNRFATRMVKALYPHGMQNETAYILRRMVIRTIAGDTEHDWP